MPKKILIAAGGTGGHLYPAIGLAKQLRQENAAIDILFAAGALASNRFFASSGFLGRSIEAGAFSRKSMWQCLKSCKSIAKGFFQSQKILKEYKPHLVIGFGSYHTFPMLLAAELFGYPFLLHEQNSQPGKVVRLFAKKALLTGVYFPQAISKLSGRTAQLSMPLREGYNLHSTCKLKALSYFNLDPLKTTLLIFGGSQGARALNEKVPQALMQQKAKNFQALHFTGSIDATTALKAYYKKNGIKAVVKDFEPHMDLAWRSADFAITRAGASTIAEQVEFEVPAILIPYLYASENHQESNAHFLVDAICGGWKCHESQLDVPSFPFLIESLLQRNSPLLEEKKAKLALYKQTACRRQFSTVIHQLLECL